MKKRRRSLLSEYGTRSHRSWFKRLQKDRKTRKNIKLYRISNWDQEQRLPLNCSSKKMRWCFFQCQISECSPKSCPKCYLRIAATLRLNCSKKLSWSSSALRNLELNYFHLNWLMQQKSRDARKKIRQSKSKKKERSGKNWNQKWRTQSATGTKKSTR